MRWRMACYAVLLAVAATGFITFVGCEDEPEELSGIDQYFADHPYLSDPREDGSVALIMTPAQATIVAAGQMVAFRAKGGESPFTWDVASGTRGKVEMSAANTDSAVYTAKSVSPNTVIASDYLGRSAIGEVQAGAPGFAITPDSVTLENPSAGVTVQFAATGGTPPYSTWRVSLPLLGTIDASGLYTVASGFTEGENTVSITDSAGATALAQVTHQVAVEALRVVPSTAELTVNGETAWFIAAGGQPPYDWSVTYQSRGRIIAESADTSLVQYERLTVGDNILAVRDARGSTANFTITQRDPTAPSVSPATASLSTNQTTAVFAASGGVSPYTWSVVTGTGTVTPSTGVQTVYRRGAGDPPNTYVIRVIDSRGQSALASINQQ